VWIENCYIHDTIIFQFSIRFSLLEAFAGYTLQKLSFQFSIRFSHRACLSRLQLGSYLSILYQILTLREIKAEWRAVTGLSILYQILTSNPHADPGYGSRCPFNSLSDSHRSRRRRKRELPPKLSILYQILT